MGEQLTYQTIRKNLNNRLWRLNNLYYIKDKQGKKVLFKLNWAQRNFYYGLHFFNIILKARQLGFTTFTLIFFLDACLFNSNHAAGVIADTRENAEDLFTNKVKFAYDNLHSWLKVQIAASTDSTRKLAFSNGSSFTVGTSLRSGTFQKLLISEYGKTSAKHPEKAREIKTGALNTVDIGQMIIIESTAEGKMGEFYEFCKRGRALQDAGKQLTRLDPKFHFYAWFDNPEYRLNDEETALQVISQETQEYLAKFSKLDKNQKAWYASKESTQGDDMKREFPSTPDEAFEGSAEGAYYSKQMAMIRKAGHITYVPYDSRYLVNTYWDIGQGADQMSILFYQKINGKHCFIDYHESNNQGWEFYAEMLKEKKYLYGTHYWPHDGNKKIIGGKVWTSKELAEQVGISPIEIQPRTNSVADDIRNHCKPILLLCWFDEAKTALFIQRIDNYRRKWDNINSMWLNEHVHDENSHGADAFRTFAMVESTKEKEVVEKFHEPGYHARNTGFY